MKRIAILTALLLGCGGAEAPENGVSTTPASTKLPVNSDLSDFIAKIKTVDNHTHANTMVAEDHEADALPLESIFPFEVPARMRPDGPEWIAAYRALYGYQHEDLGDAHMKELRASMEQVRKEQGEKFPQWVLDQVGTEVMFANRVAMGPGLEQPRFRWVSFGDALMLPLSTKAESEISPDCKKLYPYEEKLLKRYLTDLKMDKVPAKFDAYLKQVVTGTLDRHRKAGAVGVKFEAAFLRPLDFKEVAPETATKIYEKYAGGGEPTRGEYRQLQDFLFRYIARESGRLGLAVHVHSFGAPGNFYNAAGADPFLLEPTLNDPKLRKTQFVLIHGGGVYAPHAGALLWKPNVYVNISAMTIIYTPRRLASVMRDWLLEYPEKVLFGTDAAAMGPDTGWELGAWIGTTTARQALALALTDMINAGEVTREKAEEIATMVLRKNASNLYKLELK